MFSAVFVCPHVGGGGITGTRSFLGVVVSLGLYLFGGRVSGGGGRVSRGVEATSAVGINPPGIHPCNIKI